MSIIHNILGMNAQRQYGIVTGVKKKSTEKLSSGYRINRSADDAAGLAISEKMRRQIRGLNQASQNIQDGIGFCQVADGYLNEVHDIMQRMSELAVKSANGTNTAEDRSYMDGEVQELKSELHRIFSTAEFNEKKIWTVPYMPDIQGEAEDVQVFASGVGSNGNPIPGGVEINDVRYNWKELGFNLTEDGRYYDSDQEVKIGDDETNPQDYTGEKVILRVDKDAPVGSVARDYSWKADDEGILINNIRACTWSEIGIKAEDNHGTFEFDYRGQHISFEVEPGDDLQDVINGINGEGFYTEMHWDFVAYGDSPTSPALHIREGCVLEATNANEDIFDNVFEISANENGVKVVNRTDSSDTNHKMMNWSDFSGTARPEFTESYEWMQTGDRDNGAGIDDSFPIVDWGLDEDDNNADDVTFDDSVYYQYLDNDLLPITYTYDLKDETSRDAAINALDGARFYGALRAPGSTTLTEGSGSDYTNITLEWDGIDNDFDLQRTLKRNFDATDFSSSNAKILGNIQRTYTPDEDHTYTNTEPYTEPVYVEDSEEDLGSENFGEVYYEKDGMYYKASVQVQKSSYEVSRSRNIFEHYEGTYAYNGNLSTTRLTTNMNEYKVDHAYTKQTIEKQTKKIMVRDYTFSNMEEITAEQFNALGDDQKMTYYSAPVEDDSAPWEDGVKRYRYEVNGEWYNYEPTFVDRIMFQREGGNEDLFQAKFEFYVSDKGIQNTSVDFTPDGKATREFYADENVQGNTNEHYSFNESRMYPPKKRLNIQSGTEANQGIELVWDTLNLAIVGLSATNVRSIGSANAAIRQTKHALSFISRQRSDFGAQQNRLEHAYNVDRIVEENTQASESLIRDTDMAKEMVRYSKSNILAQVGESMIAQANQTKQGILNLLQ